MVLIVAGGGRACIDHDHKDQRRLPHDTIVHSL